MVDYADDVRPKYFLLYSHLHQQVYFTDPRKLYIAEFKSWLLFNYIKNSDLNQNLRTLCQRKIFKTKFGYILYTFSCREV